MVEVRGTDGFAVPEGWEPVANVVASVWEGRDQLVEDVLEAVFDASPQYRHRVSEGDLRESAIENIEMMLRGLAERRGASADEVSVRRAIGRRRADQGVSTEALIDGFFAGYEALWAALVDALPDGDDESARLLSHGALVFWRWVHDVTDALAETHAAALRAAEARLVSARDRFVELVETGDVSGSEVRRAAAAAGFEVDGPMRGALVSVSPIEGDEAGRIQTALDELGGVHAVASRGDRVVIVSQGVEADRLGGAVAAVLPDASVGVGLERGGIGGARESLLDARLALSLTGAGQVVDFENEWLWATLTEAAGRVEPLLAPGAAVATEHPHLAETVVAFSESGFSVTEAARKLDLHANTVAYRLERWRSLSGWDPRTFAGLARSLAAIRGGA